MGGEAKARGTREQRIAQAIAREKIRIEIETAHCYYQREIEENENELNILITDLESKFFKTVFRTLSVLGSGLKIDECFDLYKEIKYRAKDIKIIVKKIDKFKYRLLYQTKVGFSSVIIIKNGTTWEIGEKVNKEIVEKLYLRQAIVCYCDKKLMEEFGENYNHQFLH